MLIINCAARKAKACLVGGLYDGSLERALSSPKQEKPKAPASTSPIEGEVEKATPDMKKSSGGGRSGSRSGLGSASGSRHTKRARENVFEREGKRIMMQRLGTAWLEKTMQPILNRTSSILLLVHRYLRWILPRLH